MLYALTKIKSKDKDLLHKLAGRQLALALRFGWDVQLSNNNILLARRENNFTQITPIARDNDVNITKLRKDWDAIAPSQGSRFHISNGKLSEFDLYCDMMGTSVSIAEDLSHSFRKSRRDEFCDKQDNLTILSELAVDLGYEKTLAYANQHMHTIMAYANYGGKTVTNFPVATEQMAHILLNKGHISAVKDLKSGEELLNDKWETRTIVGDEKVTPADYFYSTFNIRNDDKFFTWKEFDKKDFNNFLKLSENDNMIELRKDTRFFNYTLVDCLSEKALDYKLFDFKSAGLFSVKREKILDANTMLDVMRIHNCNLLSPFTTESALNVDKKMTFLKNEVADFAPEFQGLVNGMEKSFKNYEKNCSAVGVDSLEGISQDMSMDL